MGIKYIDTYYLPIKVLNQHIINKFVVIYYIKTFGNVNSRPKVEQLCY